jgi:hypothetical protein
MICRTRNPPFAVRLPFRVGLWETSAERPRLGRSRGVV